MIFFALVKLSSGSHLCMVSLSVSFYESHSCRMAAEVNVLEIDAILKWFEVFMGIWAYKSLHPTATSIFPKDGMYTYKAAPGTLKSIICFS